MLHLPCTRLGSKAFVFSLDSAFAVIMLIGVVFILLSIPFPEEKIGNLHTVQLVDDSFALLYSSGYLLRTIDSNAPSDAVQNIYARTGSILPDNLSLRVELKQYTVDIDDCRLYKSFEECFLGNEVITPPPAGADLPSDRDVLHLRKILMTKQPAGDCNLEYGEFMPLGDWPPKWKRDFGLLFADSAPGPIFFQEDGDSNFSFGVSVDPPNQLSCDENATITLSVSAPGVFRRIIDVMLVMDKSGSMAECTIASGAAIHQSSGSLGGGTIWWGQFEDWQQLATFDISNNDSFDVLLEWENACNGIGCLKMYIEAPDGTLYGFYGGTPTDGCYIAPPFWWWLPPRDEVYIAVPSDLAQNGTWTVYGWNDNPAVDYDLTVKTIDSPISKFDAMKQAGKDFIDNAEWTSDDYTGLASFETTASKDQPLTSNRTAVKNKIDTLKAGGATAIGEGIYVATAELLPQPSGHGRPGAMRFQVLLSDGYTNTGRPSAGAAYDAKDNDITIFTIGLGTSIDEDELTTIAEITGGGYHYAEDENALQQIYDIIAGEIGEMASDMNVSVPIQSGATIIDYGGATLLDGNIIFDIGDIALGEPWQGSYILNFPCSSLVNCGVEAITFPGEEASFTYTDTEGVVHTIDFNAGTTVDFLTRDIRVDIFGGEIRGTNLVYLDVNVFNNDDLNTGQTTLNFRLGDLDGTILESINVPELCGAKDPGCYPFDSFRRYYEVKIESEGVIYATVNDDNSISECPLGNYDVVNCYGAPAAQYSVLDYYVWRK